MKKFDLCIVGGGMVGAATAIGCAQQGYSVCLIEPNPPSPYEPQQAPDLRVSAINMHSVELLKQLGVWSHITQMRLTPYNGLECWEQETAKTRFDAADVNYPQLGYFIENRLLQIALLEQISQTFMDNVTLVSNTSVKIIDVETGEVELDDSQTIKAALIIGADGANSQVRKAAGIGVTGWRYGQNANVISVKMHQSFDPVTWQQFTPTGPLAFLPMHEKFASLVWYADQSTTDFIKSASNAELMTAIKQAFPKQLGDFDILDKAYFPLIRSHANQYYSGKALLLGDAAHTINPLAGQGVNLGFKDVSCFLNYLEKYGVSDVSSLYSRYQRNRKPQNLLMMSAMDLIYATFSNNITPIKVMRNLGLKVADSAGLLKVGVLKYAMGLASLKE
ncbi:FAD-dependent oxidoreductase [Glaciecola sp. 1036]|uniref:FAD-dependent oxidoreductase n=1 Tax=Alteromonadaceae TaxID=72275 RepID=UPI003D02188C